MSSRIIEIIVRTNDQTSAGLSSVLSKFLAVEQKIQSVANRIKSFAAAKYSATIGLIDRVSEPGGRINSILKSLAGKAYRLTVSLTDSASGKLQQINALAARLVSRTYSIAVNVKDNASKKLSGLTEGLMQGAGTFMPIAGAAGIGFGIANAAQSAMGFEKQMSRVQAIKGLDKDSDEMRSLVEQAKYMGATTEWTREQAGQAQEYMAMAGWSVPQMNAALKPLMNLASAGGADLASTADILTDSMTGFQLKANETFRTAQGQQVNAAEHYADMMAAVVTSSNTNVSQLGEALKYSSAAVGAMYADQDTQTRMNAAQDAMVMTGLMANAGIKGSQAGTSTRAIFSRFGAENRNAKFALDALGVDFTDAQTGEVRRIRDIMGDLRQRFNEGGNVQQFADFAEQMAGTKLNADTRRKLDSFLQSVQERGGKMTGADKLKMASMLSGQEAMSGFLAAMLGDWDELEGKIENCHGAAQDMANVQLDNLSGDLTMLGSAWDAFQQDLFTGVAGDGLRGFVQTLTDVVSKAQSLFSDGIQIGDFGKIIFDVVDRLRAKFMELDGIGSILAGGVLMGALVKIGNKIRSLATGFRELRTGVSSSGAGGTSGTSSSKGGVAAGQSVGTMTVNASVVNVNGKVNGGQGGAAGRKVGNQSIIDNYNRTKASIRGDGTPPPASSSMFAGAKTAAVGGAALSAAFGVMDVMSVKEHGKARLQEANDTVAYHEQQLQNLRDSGASQAEIDAQIQEVNDARAFRQRTVQLNHDEEFRAGAGATGSVLGTALGTAIGTLGGPVGMMIGGMIGGMIGDALGQKAADWKLERDKESGTSGDKPVKRDFFSDETPKSAGTVEETPSASPGGLRQAEAESAAKLSMSDLYLEKQRTRAATAQREAATQAQTERFQQIDAKLGISSPFKNSATLNATQDFYRNQQQFMKPNANAEAPTDTPAQRFGKWLDDMFSGKPQPESAAAQEAMAELANAGKSGVEADNAARMAELANAGQSAEVATGYGAAQGEIPSIDEMLPSFEDVQSRISEFGSSAMKSLSSAFEGVGEFVSSIGSSISEGLSSAFEGAGEVFSGLGDMISSGLEGAASMASGALETISSTFTSTKDAICTAWSEVPSFFGGLFDGLGGVASAAGSAILSGLTSVCGAVISAWESVASTVSGIISRISAAASSIGSMLPSIGGGGVGKAEGGFVSAETHFFAGEHGPEVVIPLSSSRRARALDLFEKTAAILGGEPMTFGGDELKPENVPERDEFGNLTGVDIPEYNRIGADDSIAVRRDKMRAQEWLTAEAPVTKNQTPSNDAPTDISMGGINISFNISGENPQDIMSTIREHLAEVTDQIAGKLSEQIQTVHANQPLEG